MPTRYDDDDDLPNSGSRDREISLGTGTVLAIFLALALVCSLFFGLGYSMGRKSAPLASAAPSSLTPYAGARRSPASSTSGDLTPPDNQVTQPTEEGSPLRTTAPTAGRAASTAKDIRDRLSSLKPSPNASLPLPPAPTSISIDPATQSYVQVAAVSRREDADLLLAALKRRGYVGLIRQQPQDKLLHIQVGPFPSKKDAEGTRQHLIADGYNPILK